MGIRFWCPNGHKLNVKTFQAGRRGICPYCGARFVIPNESTRYAGTGDRIPEPQEHSVHEGGFTSPPAAAPAGGYGTPAPAVAAPGFAETYPPPQFAGPDYAAGPSPVGPYGAADASLGGAAPAGPALGSGSPGASAPQTPAVDYAAGPQPAFQSLPLAPTTPAAGESAGARDPLAEAPEVVWYVRPPTGGQFGPATSDVMRNWITEGRVSPDSLVWREGWRDWQEASEVFPQLGAGEVGVGLTTSAPSTAARAAAGRPRSKSSGALIIVLLVVAVLVLLAVFFWVAFGQKPGKSGPSPTKTVEAIRLDLRAGDGATGMQA